jgi:hypothetical protein
MLCQLVTNTLAYCTKVLMTSAKKLFNREICFLFNEEGFFVQTVFCRERKKKKKWKKNKKRFLFYFIFPMKF